VSILRLAIPRRSCMLGCSLSCRRVSKVELSMTLVYSLLKAILVKHQHRDHRLARYPAST